MNHSLLLLWPRARLQVASLTQQLATIQASAACLEGHKADASLQYAALEAQYRQLLVSCTAEARKAAEDVQGAWQVAAVAWAAERRLASEAGQEAGRKVADAQKLAGRWEEDARKLEAEVAMLKARLARGEESAADAASASRDAASAASEQLLLAQRQCQRYEAEAQAAATQLLAAQDEARQYMGRLDGAVQNAASSDAAAVRLIVAAAVEKAVLQAQVCRGWGAGCAAGTGVQGLGGRLSYRRRWGWVGGQARLQAQVGMDLVSRARRAAERPVIAGEGAGERGRGPGCGAGVGAANWNRGMEQGQCSLP